MKKLSKDIVFKNFWHDNARFASLFNTIVFGGEEVIEPESLQEMDTDVSGLVEFKEHKETLKRTRDVIKKSAYGIDFAIFGIESQDKIHYAMPLKVMIYDAFGYLKEYQEIKKMWSTSREKMTADEFLSGMRKDDKLHPIISIVIYYGEKEWDGPLCLNDMMVDSPEEIKAAFSDYKINLVQVKDGSKYSFANEDVQTVFDAVGNIYNKRFDEMERMYHNKGIDNDLMLMVELITGSEFFEAEINEGGEQADMWEALKEFRQEGVEEGRKEGRDEGRKDEKRERIQSLKNKGRAMDDIADIMDMTIEQVEEYL